MPYFFPPFSLISSNQVPSRKSSMPRSTTRLTRSTLKTLMRRKEEKWTSLYVALPRRLVLGQSKQWIGQPLRQAWQPQYRMLYCFLLHSLGHWKLYCTPFPSFCDVVGRRKGKARINDSCRSPSRQPPRVLQLWQHLNSHLLFEGMILYMFLIVSLFLTPRSFLLLSPPPLEVWMSSKPFSRRSNRANTPLWLVERKKRKNLLWNRPPLPSPQDLSLPSLLSPLDLFLLSLLSLPSLFLLFPPNLFLLLLNLFPLSLPSPFLPPPNLFLPSPPSLFLLLLLLLLLQLSRRYPFSSFLLFLGPCHLPLWRCLLWRTHSRWRTHFRGPQWRRRRLGRRQNRDWTCIPFDPPLTL